MSYETEAICNDNVISHGGAKYDAFLGFGEGHYFNGRTLWLDTEPGESPRPVMDGFVYGGHAFLPRYEGSPRADKFAAERAHDMLAFDARSKCDARNARSIPAELHSVVSELSATLSQRDIAKQLELRFKVKTSHAAVGRLIKQLRLAAGRARQSPAVLEEVEVLRVQLGQTFETIMDLQADLLDENQTCDKTELRHALRSHQQTAALLERRLRATTRDLGLLTPSEPIPPLNASERGPEADQQAASDAAPPIAGAEAFSPLNASERGPEADPPTALAQPPEAPPRQPAARKHAPQFARTTEASAKRSPTTIDPPPPVLIVAPRSDL